MQPETVILIGFIAIFCIIFLIAWAESRFERINKKRKELEYEKYLKTMEENRINASKNLIEYTLRGIIDEQNEKISDIRNKTETERKLLEILRKEYDAMEEKPTSIWLTFPPDTFLRYAPGKGIWALFIEGLGICSNQKFELMLEIHDLTADENSINNGEAVSFVRVREVPEAAAFLADYLDKHPDAMKLNEE